MSIRPFPALSLGFLAFAFVPESRACSVASFSVAEVTANSSRNTIVAQGFDWTVGGGIAYVNPRGLVKTALLKDSELPAASWTSVYGSLSFGPAAREFTVGGINE